MTLLNSGPYFTVGGCRDLAMRARGSPRPTELPNPSSMPLVPDVGHERTTYLAYFVNRRISGTIFLVLQPRRLGNRNNIPR